MPGPAPEGPIRPSRNVPGMPDNLGEYEMNRSLGTSSFPRARQYEGFTKSAEEYFGGTGSSSP